MLSVRSTSLALPGGGSLVELLRGEDRRSAWRVVDLYGDAPFEARLRWTAAAGLGPEVLLTVARGTRICVFARSVSVEARSLIAGEVAAGVNIGDSSDATPTRNVLEVFGQLAEELDSVQPVTTPVASFAQTVRIDGQEPSLVLELLTSGGGVLAKAGLADQPPQGLPLGSASRVRVSAEVAAPFRLVFGLAI
ncbi:MAG: hypothetical protein GY884_34845 [Proteobacteria bacterium]|nr:hypothetical protein [Pseudomonadota bacterium]